MNQKTLGLYRSVKQLTKQVSCNRIDMSKPGQFCWPLSRCVASFFLPAAVIADFGWKENKRKTGRNGLFYVQNLFLIPYNR